MLRRGAQLLIQRVLGYLLWRKDLFVLDRLSMFKNGLLLILPARMRVGSTPGRLLWVAASAQDLPMALRRGSARGSLLLWGLKSRCAHWRSLQAWFLDSRKSRSGGHDQHREKQAMNGEAIVL